MRGRPFAAIALCIALTVGGGTAYAAGNASTTYRGLLNTDSKDNILGELDCTTSTKLVSDCSARSTNKVTRSVTSSKGDLMRVEGKYADRRDNGKPTYVRIDWKNSASLCVSASLGVESSSAGGSLCSNWIGAGTSSTAGADSDTDKSFSLDKLRNSSVNSTRATVRVCENNTLWFEDICSGNRILTIEY